MLMLLAEYANWITAIGGAVAVMTVWAKVISPRVSALLSKLDQVHGVLLGRPPVEHPDTGEVIYEGTPALGVRFAHIEEAIVMLSKSHEDVAHLTERLDEMAAQNAEQTEALWVAVDEIRGVRGDMTDSSPNV